MDERGQVFGWAFGEATRSGDVGYLARLEQQALDNAKRAASGKGLRVEAETAVYAHLSEGSTLVELDQAASGLVVRCTVAVTGPGASKVHGEGPMNG